LLPVRSFSGTFALVTSPLLLRLAQRDLQEGGVAAPAAPAIEKPGARVASLGAHRNVYPPKKKIYLEELDLDVREDPAAAAWEQLLVAALPDEAPVFQGRLVVVDDETMTFLWETATQIDTRVRLQPETGTVAQGALWTEESLPPETLLIGVLAAQPSMRPGQAPLPAERVLELALPEKPFLQFGGKATVGRGRCRIHPLGQGGRR
jgi:CRISPR-associated protein Cmr4